MNCSFLQGRTEQKIEFPAGNYAVKLMREDTPMSEKIKKIEVMLISVISSANKCISEIMKAREAVSQIITNDILLGNGVSDIVIIDPVSNKNISFDIEFTFSAENWHLATELLVKLEKFCKRYSTKQIHLSIKNI